MGFPSRLVAAVATIVSLSSFCAAAVQVAAQPAANAKVDDFDLAPATTNDCWSIPPMGPIPCPHLFDSIQSRLGAGGPNLLLSAITIPAEAFNPHLSYSGRGTMATCEVPTDTVTCAGIEYPKHCFRCISVVHQLRSIPYRRFPRGRGVTQYKLPQILNYTVPTNGGLPLRYRAVPSVSVYAQTSTYDKIANITIRDGWRHQVPNMTDTDVDIDHSDPSAPAQIVVIFEVIWAPSVRAHPDNVMFDGPPADPRVRYDSFRIVEDCVGTPLHIGCRQVFEMTMEADYDVCELYDFPVDFKLAVVCRQNHCPGMDPIEWFPGTARLSFGYWCTREPADSRIGLVSVAQLFYHQDRAPGQEVQKAVEWGSTGHGKVMASTGHARVHLTNFELDDICIAHGTSPPGCIYRNRTVDSSLIDPSRFSVECGIIPPPGEQLVCHFTITFHKDDPVWKYDPTNVFLFFDMHILGKVGYMDNEEVVLLDSSADNENQQQQRSPIGKGTAAARSILSLRELPETSEPQSMAVLYAGVGMLAAGLTIGVLGLTQWYSARRKLRLWMSGTSTAETPLRMSRPSRG